MEIGLMFGVGFALGIIVGLHISRMCWPEYDESVWDRRKREQEMVNDALEKERASLQEPQSR